MSNNIKNEFQEYYNKKMDEELQTGSGLKGLFHEDIVKVDVKKTKIIIPMAKYTYGNHNGILKYNKKKK